jgi:hypothetical protein
MVRIFIIAALLVPSLASAQEASTALEQYRAQSLELRMTGWGGFSGFGHLYRDGREIDVAFFGGNAGEIFKGSPQALAHMETYQTYRKFGFTLFAVGIATQIAALGVLIRNPDLGLFDFDNERSVLEMFYGLLIGGTIVGVTGGVMMQYSERFLSEATVAYNKTLYDRLRSSSQAKPRLFISHTFRF